MHYRIFFKDIKVNLLHTTTHNLVQQCTRMVEGMYLYFKIERLIENNFGIHLGQVLKYLPILVYLISITVYIFENQFLLFSHL